MVNIKDILSEPLNTEKQIIHIINEFIDLKGNTVHLESDQWDHKDSLYNVLHYSKNETIHQKPIYIDMKHKRHKSDDGFGGISLYIPHEDDMGFTQIGINHTGFTYDGDSYPAQKLPKNLSESIYEVDINTGLRIMMEYASVVIASENLASFLTGAKDVNGNHIDDDCVSIKVSRFYR